MSRPLSSRVPGPQRAQRASARCAALALAPGLALGLALAPAGAAPTAAQGAGSAAAEILKMTAGARAAAFGGAYTAMVGDPDGLFYNPAGLAWLDRSAGLGYEAYVEDVAMGSLAGSIRVGAGGLAPAVGAGVVYLDAGDIEEVVPDSRYGGERGRATGETVGASEAAARLATAIRLPGGRSSAGVALGVVTSDLAGVERTALFVDLGAQYRLAWPRAGDLDLGAAIRHLGADLADDAYGGAPLPLEGRLGAAYRRPLGERYGAALAADLVLGIREETVGLALGGEAGLLPGDGALSAVVRAGATLGEGDGHLGRLRVGGGIGLGGLALDYTLQSFEYLGTIHRIGIRWAR